MKSRKRDVKGRKRSRQSAGSTGNSKKTAAARARAKSRRRKGLSLMGSADEPRRRYASMTEALKFYRPIKKPVTLRLDADVIAWFKREGRRYQTRINSALRKTMEREMQAGG